MTNDGHNPVSLTNSASQVTTLRVFGGFELRDDAGNPIILKARKSRLLLAYLAIPVGQVRSREQLATLLWSDRQEEQARGSLRTALSGIRRAIGNDALIVENDTVKLRPEYLDSDYIQLQNLSSNSDTISKLNDFYRGAFLEGHEHDSEPYMDWLRAVRSECTELAMSILEQNADRQITDGDSKSAIELMRECLTLEPLKEHTHRKIMQLYANSGERAMALAQFRTCKELLLHELDAAPDPKTQALADEIAVKNLSASKALRSQSDIVRDTISFEVEPAQSSVGIAAQNTENPSIAILPFVNMSGDAEQNYFADGMTEDIITDLSDVDGLSVAAKSSSQMYRGAQVSAAQISKELGVRYILEGSVRKSGDNVRISAQLTDTHTNLLTWAERYDRRLDNIFELQSEISKAIVGALRLNLTIKSDVPSKRTTTNVEAYQYYLRGQISMAEGSQRSVQLGYKLFKHAAALDPGYALAYTGQAICAARLVLHYDVDRSLQNEALENCNIALSLQPELAEAYSARGYVQLFFKKFDKAREDIEKAIQISPDLAAAHFHMGQYHLNTEGGITKAYISYKRAFELDPDLGYGMMVETCLHGLDRPEEIKSVARKILKIALRNFSLNPHDFVAIHMIAFSYNDLGETDKAKHWAKIASSFNTEDGRLTYNMACLHSVMGSIDEALMMLERTLELTCNELKVQFMNYTDPDLELVRQDPRFDKLLVRFGYNLKPRKPRQKSNVDQI